MEHDRMQEPSMRLVAFFLACSVSMAGFARASNYTLLYAFKGGNDGAYPRANLIYDGGKLYGTTSGGGTGTSCTNVSNYGCGTVFSITPGGIEKVLYSF